MHRFVSFSLVLCACATSHRGETYDVRKTMARQLVGVRDLAGALPMLQQLDAEDPEDPEVLTLRGIVYREQGLLAEAETDLRAALALDGELARAHAELGLVLDLRQDAAEALEHHRRAVELEPRSVDYTNNLAFSQFAQGKAKDAIALYLDALRLEPTNPRLRNNLGFAYAEVGEMHAAAEQFKRGGAPAEVKNNLGYAYERQGNLAQAANHYREALALDPSLTAARQNLDHVTLLLEPYIKGGDTKAKEAP
jgi:Flp pilus assembly protein TadD